MTRFLVPTALLLAVSAPAHADELGSMWGVGGHIGGRVIPFAYPVAFPKEVRQTPGYSLEKVRTNFNFGVDGMVYIDNSSRAFIEGNLDFAKGYSDANFLLGYEVVLVKGTIDVIAGGGVGIGGMGFKGFEGGGSGALTDDNNNNNNNTDTTTGTGTGSAQGNGPGGDKLRVTYFPVRAQVSAMYRQDTWAAQLTLYGELGIPGRHVYTTAGGQVNENVATPFSVFNYPSIGLEATVLYGDFKLRDKKKGGKGGKGGKGKKGKK
ncbi:MAG: hypothetical protein ACI9K2_000445 [Myxococcota bacterium]|jgi:hypothetical protein